MHVIIKILSVVFGALAGAGIGAGASLVLISPVALGLLIANRSSASATSVIVKALGLIAAIGAWLLFTEIHHDFAGGFWPNVWPMLLFFLPIYVGTGMFIGRKKGLTVEVVKNLSTGTVQLRLSGTTSAVNQSST